MLNRLTVLFVGTMAVLVTSAACTARGRIEVADFEVSLLKSPASQRAAADQLLADQALVRLAEGDTEKAVNALRSFGVLERDARRRVLAAQAASK